MRYLVLVLALAWTLSGFTQEAPLTVAQDAPFTAAAARQSAADAVEMLIEVNQALADHYFHTGEWDNTVTALDRVITLRPTDVNAYANAAWLLWSTDKTDRALAFYRRMIENNPTNPEAYYIVGQYYFFTRRDYKEALPYLEQAVQFGITGVKRHLYGHCLKQLGRTADALAFWRQQLADDPTNDVAKKEIEKLEKEPPPAGDAGE